MVVKWIMNLAMNISLYFITLFRKNFHIKYYILRNVLEIHKSIYFSLSNANVKKSTVAFSLISIQYWTSRLSDRLISPFACIFYCVSKIIHLLLKKNRELPLVNMTSEILRFFPSASQVQLFLKCFSEFVV